MALNRRQFLIGAGGLAAAATTMGLGACAPGSRVVVLRVAAEGAGPTWLWPGGATRRATRTPRR